MQWGTSMKRNNIMKGLITTASVLALSITLAGCSDNVAKPPKPKDKSCNDWQWDDIFGVWQCEDSHSHYHGSYYYGGRYYSSSSKLKSSSSYQSYTSSSHFAGNSESVSSGHESGFGGHSSGSE